MAVRDKLNEKKILGPGIAAALILVAIALVGYQFVGGSANPAAAPSKAFYSDDNGKSFFTDDAAQIAPFDHNGKQAFRADVFKGPDGNEFVGLIYRYTDGGKREMQQYLAKHVSDPDGAMRSGIEQRGMQVKPVGADDKAWQLADEETVDRLRRGVKSPSGGGPAQPVMP